jgi:betaine-aldehyde dehydrogenase
VVVATVTSALQNFIDGEFVDPAAAQGEPIINPATGEVIAEAAPSTPAAVDWAVKAASADHGNWSVTTPGERDQTRDGLALLCDASPWAGW